MRGALRIERWRGRGRAKLDANVAGGPSRCRGHAFSSLLAGGGDQHEQHFSSDGAEPAQLGTQASRLVPKHGVVGNVPVVYADQWKGLHVDRLQRWPVFFCGTTYHNLNLYTTPTRVTLWKGAGGMRFVGLLPPSICHTNSSSSSLSPGFLISIANDFRANYRTVFPSVPALRVRKEQSDMEVE